MDGAHLMRVYLSTLVFVLALAGSASAQELDINTVLRDWQKTVSGMTSFACTIERTSIDKALDAKDVFRGQVFFQKARKKGDGNLAHLELTKKTNPDVFEKYILTGSELHEFVPAQKIVRVYKLPDANQMGLPQENVMGFLFGIGVEHVKERYSMELKKPSRPDPHYHYVLITPKTARDKADFTEARLALYRENNLPAQVWFLQPNKNEVTWNFGKMQLNVPIPPQQFVPAMPPGWRVVAVALPPMLPAKK
jgi:TIGR03009 family protein